MELEYESEEQENGFERLFDAIGANSKQEIIEAEIGIYRRAEDILTETSNEVNDPERIDIIGKTVASDYADFANYLEEQSELSDNFYEMSVEDRLEHVETNPGILDYFD
jgi:hypothetical protein